MKPYQTSPDSTLHKVLAALEVHGPLTAFQLRDAVEYDLTPAAFSNALSRPVRVGVLNLSDKVYSRGSRPVITRERRAEKLVKRAGWLDHLPSPTVLAGNLRTLMDDGSAASTGDPLRALADAMDAARAVLAAGRAGKRYKGAEVELLVARELRSITIAAQLAVTTLNEALEVLQ